MGDQASARRLSRPAEERLRPLPLEDEPIEVVRAHILHAVESFSPEALRRLWRLLQDRIAADRLRGGCVLLSASLAMLFL